MATRQAPTHEEVVGYVKTLSNWGRWGPDDELGDPQLDYAGKAGSSCRSGKGGDQRDLLQTHHPGD